MARLHTVFHSDHVQTQFGRPQEAWDEMLRKLFVTLHRRAAGEFDLPLEIVMTERREEGEIWIEVRMEGRALGRRGKNWGRYCEGEDAIPRRRGRWDHPRSAGL